ncbi:MAG: zinc-binding dehydrogenase, partial [Gammaproteobacteria bacterium]
EKTGLNIGDTAVSEQLVPCWNCRFCHRGQYWMCANGDTYGFRAATQGAMANYMKFPANAINHKIPDNVPIEHAAYIEPLACAIHAVQRGQIELDDVVVIAGAGPIGMGMVTAAKLRGPRLLIVTDVRDERLELAKEAGADLVLNPARDDVIEEVRKLSGGYGCDVFIEASGHPSAIEQGLEMVRNLGTLVVFGVFKAPVTVDWSIIGDRKELNIHGSHLGPHCYPIAIDMLAKGYLPMDRIITHSLQLSDFQKGIDLAKSGREALKVTLLP